MMAADYDTSLTSHSAHQQVFTDTRHSFHQRGHTGYQRGKGKGGNHRQDSRTGNVDDFMLPEMLEDPWIDLYARVSANARESVTRHLTQEERFRMERNLVDIQVSKRAQVDSSSNSV